MNIEKRYWKWDESLNQTRYKLRGRIDDLIAEELVVKTKQSDDEFSGLNNSPWSIRVSDRRITHITYNQNFENLLPIDWDMDLQSIESSVNKVLEPTDENDNEDKLIIVFRDFFVAIAGIYVTTNS